MVEGSAPSRRRLSSEERLDALAKAGSRLLMRTSFQRLQMADVAAEMGVAVGTLYRFVESKDALLAFVVRRALDGPWTPERLPLPVVEVDEIAAWLRERMDVRDFPVMEAALAAQPPADMRAELGAVVGEMFDVLERVRAVAAVLGLSAGEFPELGAIFVDRRAWLLRRVERYVASRADAGRLRQGLHVQTAARLLFELVGWSAIRRNELPIPGSRPDRHHLRKTTVQFVVHALIDDGRQSS